MKLKMKFDAASIKKLALEHGEKLAFGIMVIVFLSFTYFAIRREGLPEANQPEKLQSIAADVKSRVANSKWDPKHARVELIDYGKRAERPPVDTSAFAMNVPFNGPLADPKVKREDPQLFNVEEIRVAGGFGPFALKGDAGKAPQGGGRPQGSGNSTRGKTQLGYGFKPPPDAKLQAQAWAVITGLVPIDKQRKEYARVFERAVGEVKERDVPHYAVPLVERAEINDADPNKLEWQPVKDMTVFEEKWVSSLAEVVAPAHTDPSLTAPLGPLVGTDWGESAAHPKIPLVWAQNSQPTSKAPEVADKDNDKDQDPGAGKPAADGVAPDRHRTRTTAAVPAAAAASHSPVTAPAPSPFKLLRVFDYSVEPNKRYRYRIKLGIDNPNYGVAPQYLRNPEAPRPQVRDIEEWSEPTDVVAIPDGNGVLAGGVKPHKTADPLKAKLLLTAIDKKGVEAAIELEFERGAVANVPPKEVAERSKLVYIARDPRTEEFVEPTEIEFKTNMVVLDIYGGRAMSKKKDAQLASPVEALLLDASGHLTVRSELDDLQMYNHRKLPVKPPKPDSSTTKPSPDPKKTKKPRPTNK